MRPLRVRTGGPLLSLHSASPSQNATSSALPVWRWLSTVAKSSQDAAVTDRSAPPLEQTYATPLYIPVTSHSTWVSRLDSGVLCERLTQRQMRQRQRKWGVLWRYRSNNFSPYALPSPLAVTPALIAASPRTSVSAPCPKTPEDPLATTAQRDAEKIAGANSYSPSCSRNLTMADAEGEMIGGARRSRHTVSVGAATTDFQIPGAVRDSATGASSEDDPLLAFLDTHEEDAALLLAMWTSLHRSCVYGSALSESLVLQVRYFLHSLLRYRAIGAAVNFYYRLMGIGVQLRQSDLLLLFSSLAYEDTALTVEAQLRKAKETAAMERDRKLWAQRRQQFRESTERTRTVEAPRWTLHDSVEERADDVVRSPMSSMNSMFARTGMPALCEDGLTKANATPNETDRNATSSAQIGGAAHIGESCRVGVLSASRWDPGAAMSELHPPRAIARRLGFHQHPEWIKRWILYEASMGTLDDPEDTEDGGELCTLPTACVESAAWNGRGTQPGAAAQSVKVDVVAVVEHLHLLAVGAMQRDYIATTEPKTPPRLPRLPRQRTTRRSRSLYVEKSYWKEALQVVRSAYAPAPWNAGLGDCVEASSPEASKDFLCPADAVCALLSMLREVQSWEGALALLRLTNPEAKHRGAVPGRGLCMTPDCFRRGAVLFMALAASAQPWKTQAKVEEWMHSVMLSRLAQRARENVETTLSETAATAALHALWLSHLCSVKASRPDDFVALGEEAAAYLASSSAQQAINGSLALMMGEVRLRTELAVDALREAVEQALQHHRASELLAKSIRTGAYRVEDGKSAHESSSGTENSHAINPSLPASVPASAAAMCRAETSHSCLNSKRAVFSPPALFLGDVMDAFTLCCAAVEETVWLRLTAAASTSCTAATVEVLQFVERSVHGPAGLIDVFQLLYGLPMLRQAHLCRAAPLVPELSTTSASERAYMSCLLAITLLRLVQLLCAPPGRQHHRLSSQIWNGAELVLLAEIAAKVLEGVTTEQVQQPPWRWAVAERLKELANVTARTVRLVVRQLRIDRMNEKVMFGALADQEVELFALLARIFSKSSELVVAAGASETSLAPSRSPLWRMLTCTCSPRTLQGVLLCFRGSSALGKRVRYRLCRREVENLDRWILPPRYRQCAFARGAAPPSSMLREEARAATRAAAVEFGVGRDFPLALSLRDSVYAIVNHERTISGVGAALQQLAAAAPDWKASLLLCQIVTRDVALARGTCSVNFFATTLDRIAQDVTQCRAAASAVAGASFLQETRSRPSRATGGILVAAHTLLPSNLWLRAIDVFWSAVDHAGQMEAAAAQHAGASAAATSATPLPSAHVRADAQERAVLARLLLPLLRFSRAADRQDIGRQWRRYWAAMYAAQEKQNPTWRQQNIEALSLLGDAAALTRCVADYRDCGNEALLCSVAVQHSDWHSALGAIFEVCGSLEERRATGTAYSAAVARTVLTLLAKSPMNLSNTAMRLRTVQHNTWDGECSLSVVRLLLRGRRWRLALTHVEEALALPDMQRVRAVVLVDPAGGSRKDMSQASPTEAMLAHYAQLLTAALQAAAIGGDNERAPVYYAAFKALLRYVFGDVVDMDALHATEDPYHREDDDGLDAALAMTNVSGRGEGHASRAEDEVQRTVRELAPRARILFFRAMTKKMLTPHAGVG
ncbi:hypothetical protein CUR178_00106 [Leishmania enriettii]|uniref:Uncharacterized protein n=1 Tax=Leishmania enriettii TaxID=5663 RepID=A0A836GWD2_LEIEN|nr:hypothetical protein CUR178_00106 [Leishmania enriettii]